VAFFILLTCFILNLSKPKSKSIISHQKYIEVQEGVRSGKCVFKGTRITIADVLELLGAGQTEQEILEDYPKLSHEHLMALYQY
jgi:uncharacterized protein (DUF433 family)